MKRLVIVLARAGALACLAAHSFAAQDGPPSAKPAVEAPAASKLGAWPKPADKEALLVEIEKLCKASTEDMERTAREALAAAGAAGVPFLLDRYGKEKVEGTNERLPLHPHNGILQLWLELGAIGAAIGAALAARAAWRATA